jgi:sigma-B regulation protein RsbU (phosphoserine phosphatase)
MADAGAGPGTGFPPEGGPGRGAAEAGRLDAGLAGEVQRLEAEVQRLEAEVQRLEGTVARLDERLEHELAIARGIQISLMPRALPQPAGWRLASAYRAAREVGGDFLDAYDLPARPGRLGFVVADVTGKGVTAALVMAFTRAVLRAAAYNGNGPGDALARTNRVLVNDARTGLFVTAFAGELDTATGRLRYASAGHEPPLLWRSAGGVVSELDLPPATLLGAFSDFEAAETEVDLEPGDLLVAFTDGVTDAADVSRTRFGDARFRTAFGGFAAGGPDSAVAGVLATIDAFVAGQPAADDITLLAIGRLAG